MLERIESKGLTGVMGAAGRGERQPQRGMLRAPHVRTALAVSYRWRTHGLPPQLVNRGRRHAAHRGGFRRPSHVRATASTATCSSASS